MSNYTAYKDPIKIRNWNNNLPLYNISHRGEVEGVIYMF